ncbi:MAG: DUF5522 domain-containing protein [Acidobacteriota bacterium]
MTSRQAAEIEETEYYLEGDRVVFTRFYHLQRGTCCGSGCRHCPFIPRWTKGSTTPEPPRREPPQRDKAATTNSPDRGDRSP